MQLKISATELNEATETAILHVLRDTDLTQNDLGVKIGCADKSGMISKVLSGSASLSALKVLNLSRLASHHGHDALGELFSAPCKVSVPALVGRAGDVWKADRRLDEEFAGSMQSGGTMREAIFRGDLTTAWQRWREKLTWVLRMREELVAIEEKGLPGRFTPAGDGAAPGLSPSLARPS